jgi:hypothetical protein
MYDRINPSLLDVLEVDDTLPLDSDVRRHWLSNLRHPFRMTVMHLCRLGATVVLCTTYFLKRLFPIQFCAHNTLQGIICWFMKWFVIPEANCLILRHFWTESNIINFIIDNSRHKDVEKSQLYPARIEDLMEHNFIKHDVVLFNAIHDLGSIDGENWPVSHDKIDCSSVKEIVLDQSVWQKRWTQCVDFETAHELFKTTFCLLLKADEYERSINSLQFDQTLAIRVGKIVGDPEILSLVYNGFPLFLVGPLRLSQRFVMHGLFTEHLNEYLVKLKSTADKVAV